MVWLITWQQWRAGFTTVRSVGSVNGIDFAVKAGIEVGYVKGPRMMCAGRIISMTCSGTEYFDGMYRVADGVEKSRDILASYGDLVKRARRNGVRIAMGTDAGTINQRSPAE